MAQGRVAWSHKETSGELQSVVLQANHAATGQAWPAGPEGNRLFRAWLVDKIGTIANLGPTPVELLPAEGARAMPGAGNVNAFRIEPRPSDRQDNRAWQETLVTGLLGIIANGRFTLAQLQIPEGQTFNVQTTDGEPPTSGYGSPSLGTAGVLDTQAFPLLAGAVIVVCVAALGAAVAWIASQSNEVEALKITQENKTTQAINAMTSAAEVVERHQTQEREKGASIPYSQAELDLLSTLRGTIASTTGWTPPPLASVPDVRQVTQSAAAPFGLPLGWIALLALGAYVMTRRGRGFSLA